MAHSVQCGHNAVNGQWHALGHTLGQSRLLAADEQALFGMVCDAGDAIRRKQRDDELAVGLDRPSAAQCSSRYSEYSGSAHACAQRVTVCGQF